MRGPGGFGALYIGFGLSVTGIVGYRGLQLGTSDKFTGLNPWKKDEGIMGAVSTLAASQSAINLEQEPRTHATLGAVACRCSQKSLLT